MDPRTIGSALFNHPFERNFIGAAWIGSRWVVASPLGSTSMILTATSATSGIVLSSVAPAGPDSYWVSAPAQGVFRVGPVRVSHTAGPISTAEHMAGVANRVVVATGRTTSYYRPEICAHPIIYRSPAPVVLVGLTTTSAYAATELGA